MITNFDIESGIYQWSTEESHCDNSHTMCEFLDFHLTDYYCVNLVDGTYAEIYDSNDGYWEVHASGNGDSFNHKVEFKKIESPI